MAAVIRVGDWLSELAKISSHQGEGMTTEEMAKQYKVGINKMRRLLGEAGRLGWLTVDYRTATNYRGEPFKQSLYSVRKPK